MATTGFWPVKSRLKDVIDYAENPDKTIDKKCVDEDLWNIIRYSENDSKTDKKMYVSGINCSPKTAYEQMSATKARFGKQDGNVAYHGYQSFKTGEVTPEEAHEIGVKTARRMWGSRFEIVVTTHLNTDNIHNHIVINSVSFVDGKKYENHIRDHIALREESDEICKEYGKSVLKDSNLYSKGKKKEYWIHKNGGMTHRDMLKRDIDEALSVAMTRQQFDHQLMMLGYRYARNGNYAHPSIIAPGWKRAVRIDSLGEKYTEENIRRRILQNPNHPEFEPRNWIKKPQTPLYEIEVEFRKAMQLDAIQLFMQIFIDMLLHALNLDTPERKRPISPLLRDEVRKLDKYNEQIRLLAGFEIETGEKLLSFIEGTGEKIKNLENERQKIYNKIRGVKTPEEEEKLKQRAKDISAEIKPLRKRKKTAEKIAENIPKIKELLKTEMEMEVSVLQKENIRQTIEREVIHMKNIERFIENIEITKLHPFEGNPYKVRDDADMESLEESISEQGIAMPLLVRPLENTEGEYEIISGHRRLFAARRLGLNEVPVIVYDISREDAIVMLVDSNLFREHVLPSEKAFAYKMKLEAMNHKGRTTCGQVGHKSRDNISEEESGRQIQRYIRLTQLIGELLILVDEGKIAFTPAVELSFLNEHEQRTVLEHVVLNDCTPSLSQANRMKKLSQEGKLTPEEIQKIMSEEKANQREMFKVPVSKIEKYVPKGNRKQLEDFVLKACEYYAKYLIKQKERER